MPIPPINRNLDSRHVRWIIDWALEKCSEHIAEYEALIMRHQYWLEQEGQLSVEKDKHALNRLRSEVIASLQSFLTEYHHVYHHLKLAKARVSTHEAEVFAQGIAEMFRDRKRK